MAPPEAARRLIVNADDFGRSSAINQAVIRAHSEGILTSASLMVNGAAFEEAVELARHHPSLGVGLHLTLVCGGAALSKRDIPGLVDDQNRFSNDPVRSGFRYFAKRSLRPQLLAEIDAQCRKFHETGLVLDHLDGHLNLHLHPTIFSILKDHLEEWGISHFRLTRDFLWLNLRLARGQWIYRLSHALIFGILARRARPSLRKRGIRHTGTVFGLLQNGRVDESFLLSLLPQLPPGDSELYSHPSLDQSYRELAALVSPKAKALARALNIKLIRYQDL